MRPLAMLTLAAGLTIGTAVQADDKPEDKAKAVAVAFMKALKAKDVDAALKEADVPFLFPDLVPKGQPKLDKLEKRDAVTTSLKSLIEKEKKWDVPIAVGKVVPLAEFKKAAAEDPKAPEMLKQILDVGGADGFAVFMNDEKDQEAGGLVVRIKGGSAKVVGIVPVGRAAPKKP